MPKRSKLEIYFDVLRVIGKGVSKPTRIMYGANLSWRSLEQVFAKLIAQGFIEVEEQKTAKRYGLTPKGQRALQYYYRALEDLVTPEQIIRMA